MNSEQGKAGVLRISSALFHFFGHRLFDFTFRDKAMQGQAEGRPATKFSAVVSGPRIHQQAYHVSAHGKY
jgi:hypothetical protein